ncbi:hypothetical protein [Kitasatospora sp. GP82]|uniref:hypothetical protein n=1 Tax=Kitasatospora sp. GP82 TaxID=3035089 RepID=UPI002473AB7C|nr:hypothetical protein [Kitasatospora sp. GP82]MDH6129812.1 hypothetical protein [Kitasatospora sp. GP82]
MDQAATAYEAAHLEAEEHAVAGERATCQAQLALAAAFADPQRAGDELALADQLLAGLDLRATTLTTRIAHLVASAGTNPDLEQRADVLRADIQAAGLTAAQQPNLELALCFHHAVQGADDQLATVVGRLRELTQGGD